MGKRKSSPPSFPRRCSGARASTLTQSKRRWGNGWLRQRRRAKAPASNRNDLHGGRLARAARQRICKSRVKTIRPNSRAGARPASRRSKTVDDEILDLSLKSIDKARSDGEPFF